MSGILSVSVCLNKNEIIDIALDKLEAIAGDESGSTLWDGYVNNIRTCVVKETYTCNAGNTVPSWIPYWGGTECSSSFTIEFETSGTFNDCIYSGNKGEVCAYYGCTIK